MPKGADLDTKSLRLERARMCVYWPSGNKGVVGLASAGPAKGSKITPAAPAITLQDITAVMETTQAAVTAWEAEPWS
ncbi:MAG: hypothetical protein KIT08_01225 [Anaerolineales bacterium]|nr:MAG: hypothetical protein KIT08_01225 [Anaerolineales bacterium]